MPAFCPLPLRSDGVGRCGSPSCLLQAQGLALLWQLALAGMAPVIPQQGRPLAAPCMGPGDFPSCSSKHFHAC